MRAAVLVVVLAGCGRLDFDDYVASRDGATSDAKPTCTGHDEDGEGYGDACSVSEVSRRCGSQHWLVTRIPPVQPQSHGR